MTETDIMATLGIDKETLDGIDKGIIPLLYELNKKGYKTCGSCEGHTRATDGKWNIALGFAHQYYFITIPIVSTYKFGRESNMLFMNWDGIGEENRLKKLDDLLEWAKELPTHNKTVKTRMYTLIGTNKKGRQFRLKTTTNLEEIRFEMSKEKNQKYNMIVIDNVTEEW